MKKNHYCIILLCILGIICFEFCCIKLIILKTRLYPKTEIELNIRSVSLEDKNLPLEISKESLKKLQEILVQTSLPENQNILLENFDKERNFYISFITIISIVLSIFGIAPVIYGIFEKNENQKLRDELEYLKSEYHQQVELSRLHEVLNDIKDKYEALKDNTNFIFQDSTIVSSYDDMDKYVRYFFTTQLSSIRVDLLKDDTMKLFSLYINNFMLCVSGYVVKKYAFSIQKNTNGTVTVKDVTILKTIITIIQAVFGEKKYKEFLNNIMSLPNNRLDFSGL